MLHIICAKAEKYSADYVNVLYDSVCRNLPEGLEGDFTCLTDDPSGLTEGIIAAPPGSFFSFKPEDTVLHLQLNIVITGPLDGLVAGNPDWQERRVVSYHRGMDQIPDGISIVKFDGDILPHEVTDGWVPMVWKIGGGTPASFIYEANVPRETIEANIRAAMAMDVQWLKPEDAHDGIAMVCAGGPSLLDDLETVRIFQNSGAKLYAVNNTINFLMDRGIEPDFHVMLDARDENAAFLPSKPYSGKFLYSSQCAPMVLEQVKSPILWHPFFDGIMEITGDEKGLYIGGGSTVGLRAVILAHLQGFRKIHLFGFDSSYRSGEGHAYSQPLNSADRVMTVIAGGESFKAAPWMITQAEDFKAMAPQMVAAGCELAVHGDGLLPTVARLMTSTKGNLQAVYDLALSPPTYEFFTFLHEAEKARIAGGYAKIDLIFQPGPAGGFREDRLPLSIPMRKGMLQRVCVAGARLLPSIGKITVLERREPVSGDIFPTGWSVADVVSHHGPSYCHSLEPILRPSDFAREYVRSRFPKPFVCITLRSAKHWPTRNSDFVAWEQAARFLEREGYKVVWIPDEDGTFPDACGHECREAFFDIDIRAALYEACILSLGVSNGPLVLMGMLNCHYLAFDKPSANFPCGKKWLMDVHGFGDDPQFSSRGRLVWREGDAADILLPEIEATLFRANARKIA